MEKIGEWNGLRKNLSCQKEEWEKEWFLTAEEV